MAAIGTRKLQLRTKLLWNASKSGKKLIYTFMKQVGPKAVSVRLGRQVTSTALSVVVLAAGIWVYSGENPFPRLQAYVTKNFGDTEAEKKNGRSVEQTVDAVTAAFGERAPDKGRLAGAIKSAYAEAP